MGYASNGTWTSDFSGAEIDGRLAAVSGVNLLDNWYFINPINQRGQNSYPTGTAGYTIDRFYKTSPISVTLNSGYITIAFVNATGYNYLYQKRETPLPKGTYTLSVLVRTDSTHTELFTGTSVIDYDNSQGISIEFSPNGYFTAQADIPFRVINAVTDFSLSIDIIAMKLELGSQQTLARQVNGDWVLNDPAPNYQQELAKCQRYFVDVIGILREYGPIAVGYATSSTVAYFMLNFPVTMRDVPTMSMTGSVQLGGDIDGTLTMNRGSANSASVIFTLSSGTLTQNTPVGLRQKFVPDAHIFFSAEL